MVENNCKNPLCIDGKIYIPLENGKISEDNFKECPDCGKNPNWIEITCQSCGRSGNYLPTISGTTPCSNSRCHKLLKVPVKNPETGTKLTEKDIDEILGRR